tara:strand:+ start:574 stop:1056 length:483 start_codon:yes stop_codon:yes gene_type:complete
MIQFKLRANNEAFSNFFDINLYDKFDNKDNVYRPLITFTSRFTGKSKTVLANLTDVDDSDKKRYIGMGVITSQTLDNLEFAVIKLGTTDFPLGFYDAVIYENTSSENMDTTGLKIVYNGVMHLEITEGDSEPSIPPVVYTEFTGDASDINTVYLTSDGAY